MQPIADTHVHLLAGLDDGPPNEDVAIAMCRMLVSEGASEATALAHQNLEYSENTPERIIASATALANLLRAKKIPLTVHPSAEIMASYYMLDDWKAGEILSIGNHKQFLLVEMPHAWFVDLLPLMEEFQSFGLRIVVAHAERCQQLIQDPELTRAWVNAGCLIQVTAQAIAYPWDDSIDRGLSQWAANGLIHLIGSDGHGIDRRQPLLAAGYRRLVKLVGRSMARKIGWEWGRAILNGEPIEVPLPGPSRRSWFGGS